MAKQLNQILHEPPLLHDMIDGQDSRPSPVWQRFMVNLHAWGKQFFPVVTAQTGTGIEQLSLSQAAQLTTAQRDQLQNVANGVFIYNTTTNKFNFRENGAWVEYT